jgi:hypothetical protein
MITKSACFIWLLIISGLAPVPAQDRVSLVDRIESSVQQKRPGWKLVSRRVSKNRKYGAYRWESRKSFVNVLVFVQDSAAEAKHTYHNFDLEAFGLKRKVLEGIVLDLGDENYAWENSNDRRETGIDFRKGKVFVHLTAPTIEDAKQFAFLIAEDLPAI